MEAHSRANACKGNGDSWKVAQDLAIDSDELNLLLLRQSDEFTVVSRTGRNRDQL
jgi:hypothetical protein